MYHYNKNRLSGSLHGSQRSRRQVQSSEELVWGFVWVINNPRFHIMRQFLSFFFDQLTHHLLLNFPPNFSGMLYEWFSHFTANWNHLGKFLKLWGLAPTLHILISWYRVQSDIKRLFLALQEILMCSKNWETGLYMLSASIFSNLIWKKKKNKQTPVSSPINS